MRTLGTIKVGSTGTYALSAECNIVFDTARVESQSLPSYDLLHAVACWNAIESIGGDPGTVAELREALEAQVACVETLLRLTRTTDEELASFGPLVAARTVLAKTEGS